jgi:hypothetical protein
VSAALPTSDHIYWAFSSAAQTIGAFVAFLLAGYALVQTMMEAAAREDETLAEIYDDLKMRYHGQMSVLAIVTGIAIIGCLMVVYFNGFSPSWVPALEIVAVIAALCSIIGGIWFVISMVDPGKYRKAAQRLAQEVEPKPDEAVHIPSKEFFEDFVRVERLIRELWEQRTDGKRLGRRQGPASFREMIEALVMAQILPPHLYKDLLQVSRHRNLVFHGHVVDVSRGILEQVRSVR